MPELDHGLFKVMRRLDGAKFYGHLTTSTAVTTKEKAPYRVLHARLPTFLKAGDIVKSYGGEVIILMEHPDDFDWARSFKAVYALEQMDWTREQTVIHPVTSMPKQGPQINLGKLYVNFDMAEEISDGMGYHDTKYRFITGQDVKVGDKVGEWRVQRVALNLGVRIVYAA